MIYSLVGRRIEDVPAGTFATGVTRFDRCLRGVFHDLVSVTPAALPEFKPGDVVIADNHLSLLVPDEVATIVVHHGCAQTHYDRDPHWRNEQTRSLCSQQRAMFDRPNRTYVAPSRWVCSQFVAHYGLAIDYADIIVNWVETPILPRARRVTPRIIGDWRDFNKGAEAWRAVAAVAPGADFVPCRFVTEHERSRTYFEADLYLGLSLSEGGSYSMCDAEAAGLPIVSTDVGNARTFRASLIFDRDDARGVAEVIDATLFRARRYGRSPSYFSTYTFDHWASDWRRAVERARDQWRLP